MARVKKTDTKKKIAVAEATKTLAAKAEKIMDTATKKVAGAKIVEKEDPSTEKASIVLQFAGKDYSYDELVQNAKNKFQYDMGGDVEAMKEISDEKTGIDENIDYMSRYIEVTRQRCVDLLKDYEAYLAT